MTELENAEKLFQSYKVKEAYPLFQKLAGEGQSRALYFLALYDLYNLDAVSPDPKEAIRKALEGARADDGLCGVFCMLHYDLLSHEEFHEIMDAKEKWIDAAKKESDVFALEALGCLSVVHGETAEEVHTGLHLLEAAALQGYWKAWNDLGQFHDRHVKDNNPLLKPYIDDKKSISCYRKSMEAGYPDSMNRLAYFYYLGDGVPKDEKEGIRLFKKAFSKGHLKAGTALGMLYLFDEKGGAKKKASGIRRRRPKGENLPPWAIWPTATTMAMARKKTGAWPKNGMAEPPMPAWTPLPPSWESCTMKMDMMIKPLPFSKRPQTGDFRKPWAGWPPAISTAMVRR